jgi:hypothetical protein
VPYPLGDLKREGDSGADSGSATSTTDAAPKRQS